MNEVSEHNRIDELEVEMLKSGTHIDCPVDHKFTPGLYSRTIFMDAGILATSRTHNTRHQYVISAGKVSVRINDEEWEFLEAPYIGVTEPGTRRVLYVHEPCLWTTFHPVDFQPEDDSEEALLEAVDKVDQQILDQRENAILGTQVKNNILLQPLKIQ